MRVLLLAHDIDTTSGSGRNATTIVTTLEALGYEVELLGYKKDFWHYLWQARRAARRSDIVQTIDVNPLGYIGYLATRFTKAKLVIVGQAAYAVAPLHNAKTALISRVTYRACDAVVAGSRYVAEEIEKMLPGLSVTVIDPGIDMQKFLGASAGGRAPREDPPYLLGVGAVKDRKGYDVSMRAFALAKQEIPSLRYRIVGSQTNKPLYFASLVRLAEELGVSDSVEFLTKVPDDRLNQLYARAALFILTSINDGYHFEGFGMVFLEAAAYGLPSIGTSGNGIADAVEDGKTGILVPQRDIEATADAIKKIVGDPALAARMSERAQAFARAHDTAHLVRTWGDLYRSLCA